MPPKFDPTGIWTHDPDHDSACMSPRHPSYPFRHSKLIFIPLLENIRRGILESPCPSVHHDFLVRSTPPQDRWPDFFETQHRWSTYAASHLLFIVNLTGTLKLLHNSDLIAASPRQFHQVKIISYRCSYVTCACGIFIVNLPKILKLYFC